MVFGEQTAFKYLFFENVSDIFHVDHVGSQVSGCPSSTTCGLLILIDDVRDLGYRCMLTVLICDLRNSALNVALGQLIIAGAVCVPRKKTFYYKKTNKHGKVGFGTGFSPQTGVQDIQTNSLEPRGLVLHSKQREGKQKCLGIAVLREEVMLGVVATSPTSL